MRPLLTWLVVLACAAGGGAGLGCRPTLRVAVGARFVSPSFVRQAQARERAVVVDVRAKRAFEAAHVPGSLRLTVAELNGYLFRGRIDRKRLLVLVGDGDLDAALAVPTATALGYRDVHVLAGGFASWTRQGQPVARGAALPLDPGSTTTPKVTLTRSQQAVAYASGGVIKPAYMVLALLLLILLWGARSPDLRLLWHGVLWFEVGEAFCAVNFYFHTPGALVYPVDLLHGAGMVAMSALLPWGLFRMVDDRVLHYADPERRCLAQRFCGRCWKRDEATCAPHRLMYLVVAALAVVSLLPLTGELRPTQFTTTVFGSAADYGAPIWNHLVELRVYPVLGALGFLIALPLLRGGPEAIRRAEPVFFAALGFTTYSLLRFFLVSTFRDTLWWSDFWEELTELLMLGSVGLLLLVFRKQLGLRFRGRSAPGEPAGDAT